MNLNPYPAILLLGPTGAGKTPLGALCESRGLWLARVFHFDFGAILRRIAAAGAQGFDLSQQDLDTIRQSLATGALLENRDFHIARGILLSFAAEKRVGPADYILLNGLPRHSGQACALEPYVRIERVVALACSPEIVQERIRRNSGGDRGGRNDDDAAAVAKKLEIYRRQTAPLLAYYRRKGAGFISLAVEIETGPEPLYARLNGATPVFSA